MFFFCKYNKTDNKIKTYMFYILGLFLNLIIISVFGNIIHILL